MVQFIDLWRAHPLNDGIEWPCRAMKASADAAGNSVEAGQPAVRNQAAIRLGIALHRCGVRIEAFGPKIATCGVHDRSEMHILYPRQLADALNRAKLAGFGAMELIEGGDVETFQNRIAARTGVLYVRDFWARTNDIEGQSTGDAIDLWNGYRTTENWLMELMAWAGYRSPYAQAREMWFWPVA